MVSTDVVEPIDAADLKTNLEELWGNYLQVRYAHGFSNSDEILKGKVKKAIGIATSLVGKPIPDNVMKMIGDAIDALERAIYKVAEGDADETSTSTRELVEAVSAIEM